MKVHNLELRDNATINHLNLAEKSEDFSVEKAQGKIWYRAGKLKIGSNNQIIDLSGGLDNEPTYRMLTLLSTSTATGTWAIEGVTPNTLLYIFYSDKSSGSTSNYAGFKASSGLSENNNWVLGSPSSTVRGYSEIVIAIDSTVVFTVGTLTSGTSLKAYQYK